MIYTQSSQLIQYVFILSASSPQLVLQKLWFALSSLWDSMLMKKNIACDVITYVYSSTHNR